MKASLWVKGATAVATVSAAIALPVVPGVASASTTTSGNGSVLGGNQINLPISIPVDVCGNAVAVLGGATAGCKGGASVTNISGGQHARGWRSDPSNSTELTSNSTELTSNSTHTSNGNYQGKHRSSGATTSGNGSILGGNQINAPVSVPVDVCGNGVGVLLGTATAKCKGGASVTNVGNGLRNAHTSGDGSIGGGNQVSAPVSVPVDVCGNAVGVLGSATAGCKGGSTVTNVTPPPNHHKTPPPCHHKTPPPNHHKTPPPNHHKTPPPNHHKTPPPTTTTTTSTTTPSTPKPVAVTTSSTLPTTGADIGGIAAAAAAAMAAGAGSMVAARRRRSAIRA